MGNGYPHCDSVKGWGTGIHPEITGIHPEGRGMGIHPETREKGGERVFALILRRRVGNGYPSWIQEKVGERVSTLILRRGVGNGYPSCDSGEGWGTGIHPETLERGGKRVFTL